MSEIEELLLSRIRRSMTEGKIFGGKWGGWQTEERAGGKGSHLLGKGWWKGWFVTSWGKRVVTRNGGGRGGY